MMPMASIRMSWPRTQPPSLSSTSSHTVLTSRARRDADGQDDERVHNQSAGAASEWPAAQAADQRLDGGGQQDGQEKQKQDVLDAPEQVQTDGEAQQDQACTRHLDRRELVEDH